jgi:L-malate glycosyltransferase
LSLLQFLIINANPKRSAMCKPAVCLIQFNPNSSGFEEEEVDYRVARVANLMEEAGYNIHVVVLTLTQDSLDNIFQRRCRCHTSQNKGNYVHRIESTVRNSTFSTQDLCGDFYSSLRQLHLKYEFDLFHLFSLFEVGYVATLLAKEYGVPVVHSVRGADLYGNLFDNRCHNQIRWTLENSDWVTFSSQDVQRSAIALAPAIRKCCSVVVDSVDPLSLQTLDSPIFLPAADSADRSMFVIGAVGSFRRGEGTEYLIDACAYLNCSMDLSLVLLGDFEEEDRAYWEQEITDSGLGDRLNVVRSCNHSQVLASLAYLDVLVMPSAVSGIQESCSRLLPEAMLAGCTVVGTAVDVIAELLGPERAGLLVKPADSGSLMAALWQLAQQPMLRELLGARAKKVALTRCAPAEEQRAWMGVYQQATFKCRRSNGSIEISLSSCRAAVKSTGYRAPMSDRSDLKAS